MNIKKICDFGIGLSLQLGVFAGDILLIVALCIVFRLNWVIGVIAFIFTCWAQNNVGGWAFGWRPRNIKTFFRNWMEFCGHQESKNK